MATFGLNDDSKAADVAKAVEKNRPGFDHFEDEKPLTLPRSKGSGCPSSLALRSALLASISIRANRSTPDERITSVHIGSRHFSGGHF